MSVADAKRLKGLIESGALLHPVSEALSIVDLANALHNVMGVPDAILNDRAMGVKKLIGEPEHLVLVLADGFGMNFVETLDEGAFIRKYLVAEMRTVFPSTTPIVLTTLATEEWPGKHGVIGWFLRLREIDAVSTIISYIRTADKKSLSKLGVRERDAYPVPSRIGMASREALHIMPQQIAGSAYSTYWTGGTPQAGYDVELLEQAIEMAIERIRSAQGPTCTYIYVPHVDSAAHKLGATHSDTLNAAMQVDRLLESLANSLPSNSRVVMTADHGHLDAPVHRSYELGASDEIISLCSGMPTGDQRAIYAHVRDENLEAFRAKIHERYGDDFLVLTAKDVEELGLLGVGTLSDETRYRMGDALVLSTGDAVLDYRTVLGDERHPMVSHHGGLTPAEMRIPLVVA